MCEACHNPHFGRREFLGGVALAGAGVFASMALPGCASGNAGASQYYGTVAHDAKAVRRLSCTKRCFC